MDTFRNDAVKPRSRSCAPRLLRSAGGTTGPTGLGMSYVYREGDGYREFGGFQQHDLNFR